MSDGVRAKGGSWLAALTLGFVVAAVAVTPGVMASDVPGASLHLKGPADVAVDAKGSLYVADTGNCRILRVTGNQVVNLGGECHTGRRSDGPARGITIGPTSLIVEPSGSVLFTSGCAVRRLEGDRVTTVAGSIDECASSDHEDPASKGLLGRLGDIDVGPDGSIYVVDDATNRVSRIGPSGVVTTVAGNGEWGFSGDGGPATAATFRWPRGVVVLNDGSLLVADSGNCRLRRVHQGKINTFAGTDECRHGGDGGAPKNATFSGVGQMTRRGGAIYVAQGGGEERKNCGIRRLASSSVTTVAGSGRCGFSGDGGLATRAALGDPGGLAVAPDGSVYVADRANCVIRRVDPDGIITSVVGDGFCSYSYAPYAGEGDEVTPSPGQEVEADTTLQTSPQARNAAEHAAQRQPGSLTDPAAADDRANGASRANDRRGQVEPADVAEEVWPEPEAAEPPERPEGTGTFALLGITLAAVVLLSLAVMLKPRPPQQPGL